MLGRCLAFGMYRAGYGVTGLELRGVRDGNGSFAESRLRVTKELRMKRVLWTDREHGEGV